MAVVVVEAAVAATSVEWVECHAAALVAECRAAASLVAAWARAARQWCAIGARNNWHGNNWHGNNWHGNNWHNGHHHNGNDVIFIGGFGFPWWWGWGPWWGWDYGYPYSATAIILMATVAPTATVTVVAATVMGTTTLTGVTSMVMATGTDTAPSISLGTTATAADPESPSCNGGCHGLAITMDPSTESWGRKRGEQSGRTSKTTITQVNRRHSGHADREAANNLFG